MASSVPTDLRNLRVDVLREAVALYLKIAYDGAEPPEVVRRRLDWPTPDPGSGSGSILERPPFERSGKGKNPGEGIYALRLGNARYPHMKLQIQPWPNDAGFMLSVNTHDQVLSLDQATADLPAFRALQAENQRLKEAIEQAWDDARLPTFLRYLREYIEQRTGHDAGAAPPPAAAGS